MSLAQTLLACLPEVILALGLLGLLGGGVLLRREEAAPAVYAGAAFCLLLAGLALPLAPAGPSELFGGSFVIDSFSQVMKGFALLGALAAVLTARGFSGAERLDRFEYPVLILIAALGMMLMISAHDLIAVYLGLEMQSLALYVLVTFRRDLPAAGEAGLKYFVLGALSSGLLLYGCSLVYGFSGSLTFGNFGGAEAPAAVIVGMVFILAGMAFKISAVPFHMWTPDVYQGAPAPVVLFLAAAPKLAAMSLLARLTVEGFGGLEDQWRQIIIFLSAASMLLGAFAAIGQTSIKRLIAYSSIGHMGYALIGLAAGAPGIESLAIYMIIYMITVIGVFCALLSLRRGSLVLEDLSDFDGLARTRPLLGFIIAAFMFSLAGIPPLAGFFAKFYVFLAAIEAGLVWLAIIGVVSSVIAAYYYLAIVKRIYFDEPVQTPEFHLPGGARAFLTLAVALVLFFAVVPQPVAAFARLAAGALTR